ncbi:hypothetical protein [Actinophytocola sp.]|uniref:hypothetical protein n=1 Tax=Actinophytocola sp. TaxID=1872138 RepID=UPI002D7E2C36|nr:hypothetical protein [Actinophytocola sp.]HET9144160.1 hypothetical protein [Actinophytocola sp.]
MIVDVKRLNKYMSSPQWTDDQQDAAADVLAGLESTLESALYGAYITPRSRVEEGTVLESGLVVLRQPVAWVASIDGTATDVPAMPEDATPGEGQTLPSPWTLTEHRLRRIGRPGFGLTGYSTLTPSDPTAWGIPASRIGSATATVTVSYLAGWGNVPALAKAIMDKARAIMFNTHDDTAAMRNTDAAKAPPAPAEDWTDAELAKLGTFRNLAAWR